jgi:RNA polymerase sigma-70 factor (ECF subfamily)
VTIPPSISRSGARSTEGRKIPTPTDHDLIRGIAQKNPAAFREFVERYQGLVYSVCLNLLGSRQEAQDAAQEVFLQVFRSAADFRFESKASTWLYRIAVNRSRNLLRQNRRHRRLERIGLYIGEEAPAGDTGAPGPAAPPDIAFEDDEQSRAVADAVADLPESQRITLILNKYLDLPAREISDVLGVPKTAVEARLRRGKSRLKQILLAELKK